MIATHEDFLRSILENIVVDNFLMQFSTLAQDFKEQHFHTKRCVFSHSTTYQKFTLGSLEKISKEGFTRQKVRILTT